MARKNVRHQRAMKQVVAGLQRFVESAVPARPRALTDLNITASDVAAAEQAIHAAGKAWERYGCRRVTDGEVMAAEDSVSACANDLQRFNSWAWKWVRLRVIPCWLVWRTGIGNWGWVAGGLFAGTGAVVLAAVPMVLMFGRLPP